MAAEPVTYDDVEAAANALEEQGIKLSVRRVVAQLGRSSPATVLPFYREYRSKQRRASAALALPDETVSPELRAALNAEFNRREDGMRKTYGDQVAELTECYETAREELERQSSRIEELQSQVTSLTQQHSEELDGLRQRLAVQESRAEEAESRVKAAEAERDQARSDAQASHMAAAEARLKIEALDTAHKERIAEIESTRKETKAATERAVVAERQIAVCETARDSERERLREAVESRSYLETKCEKVEAELKSLRDRVQAAEQRAALSEQSLQHDSARRQEMAAELDQIKGALREATEARQAAEQRAAVAGERAAKRVRKRGLGAQEQR